MKWLPVFGAFAILACDLNPSAKIPIAAARIATQQYAKQNLKADAAGDDCKVLLVQTKTGFDQALVESIHYGVGESKAYPGGIQKFADTNGFRAVVYRDSSNDLWTYGAVTLDEAKTLHVCR